MRLISFSLLLLCAPLFAFAQDYSYWSTLVSDAGGLLFLLFGLLTGVALLGFFWGLAKFILSSDSEEERDKGKNIMVWGMIGLFIITSIWGVVAILMQVFGVEAEQSYNSPVIVNPSFNPSN